MKQELYSKMMCPRCRGSIEYPREGAGQQIPCPHCGADVLLAAAKPPRAHLLIEPKTRPIHVKESALVIVLTIIGVIQLIAAPLLAGMSTNSGVTEFAIMIAGGITTLAFAKLIESTHETAQRLARLEVYFQTVVNERL